MERNYDEIIAEMLIQLDKNATLLEDIETRMKKADKRMDLTIKRMVKSEERMDLFDKKLEQSIKLQREFSQMQSKMNKYFLEYIRKHPLK